MVSVVASLAASLVLQTPAPPAVAPILGAWTLNTDLSDARQDRGDRNDGGRERGDGSGRRGGGYGGRGGFRGGYRGGMRGGGANQPMNPEAMARMRDAMRDITTPSDRLTIVQSGALVIITGADGRTTRLSPDGKKIKDDDTGIERKTKWDGGKLVSEISGLGSGKMTQTFAVDPDSHQLRVTVQIEGRGGRSNQPRTITNVYDKDSGGN
jgi:hypothetical protein